MTATAQLLGTKVGEEVVAVVAVAAVAAATADELARTSTWTCLGRTLLIAWTGWIWIRRT